MALCGRLKGTLTHTHSSQLLKKLPSPFFTPCATMFYEKDPKSGYDTKLKTQKKVKLLSKEGISVMKKEKDLLVNEWKFALQPNPPPVEHNDYEIVWQFNGAESIKDWVISTDQDLNEGYSTANFTPSKGNKGLFYGNLSTKLPKDGKIKMAGYCQIRSPFKYKSFQRRTHYDWVDYTHLIIRCRGDGRTYGIIAGMDHYYDVQWHDQYNYALFTRGGPYWQTAKIPFSKFFLVSKGRIQDKQEPILLDCIKYLGITIGDQNSGPFQLEIDYIALVQDFSHKEQFAYEMYHTPVGHAGT